MIWFILFAVVWPVMTLLCGTAAVFGYPLVRKEWQQQVEDWKKYQLKEVEKLGPFSSRIYEVCSWCAGYGVQNITKHAVHKDHILVFWYLVRWFFGALLWPLTIPFYLAYKKGSMMVELGNKSKELDEINQKILHAAANLAAIKDQIADAKSERANVLNLDKRRGLKN